MLDIESPNGQTYLLQYEDTYNKNLVDSDKEKYFHLDKELVKVDKSKFEMCDILTYDRKLLHIKHFTSSAVLSHLFNQGLVSAECLKDKNIRKQANKQIDCVFKLDETDNFKAEDYEVVFVIAKSNAQKLPVLPFFSKVALRNVALRLQLIGYKYSICGVPYTYVDPNKDKKKKKRKK